MIKTFFKSRRWKSRDVIILLERLELYVSSGLPIDRALRISAESLTFKQKTRIFGVCKNIESGAPLSDSLSGAIGLSQTVRGIIEHGGTSGSLAQSFDMARSLLERQDELKKKCLSAMTYPVIIGCFALLLAIGLIRGVMPEIIPMLKSLHIKLPFLTRLVIAISDGLTYRGLHIILIGLFTSVGLYLLYRRSPSFRSTCQAFIIKIPLVGRLVRAYSLSVFLRSCGALIDSGLSVPKAYESTVDTITLIPLRSELHSRITVVIRGTPLYKAIGSIKIPSYVSSLLRAGEESGTLGRSVIRAATIMDRDIENSLKLLSSLIEPVMMAGMGVIVGSIALSIMMPIYDISRVLQH